MSETALITGATGGIGLELAKVFAENHYNLVLIARNDGKLAELRRIFEEKYGVAVTAIPKDLTEETAAEEIFGELCRQSVTVDILVNNAGLGDFGSYCETDWDKQLSMIQLNIVAMLHLTRLLVNPMIKRSQGKILNVASIAAFQPGPLMSVYYASKAFVLSFSEALSKELENAGVTVTALCPGPTETGFERAASLEGSRLFRTLKPADAREVAWFGYRALMKGKTVAVYGFFNRLLALGARIAPRRLLYAIVYQIQGKVEA